MTLDLICRAKAKPGLTNSKLWGYSERIAEQFYKIVYKVIGQRTAFSLTCSIFADLFVDPFKAAAQFIGLALR